MLALALAFILPAAAVRPPEAQAAPRPSATAGDRAAVDQTIDTAVQVILSMQATGEPALEGAPAGCEWPYEGVYRVAGGIPIGYRIGGTSICAMALLAAPGYAEDPQRQQAVRKACAFVCAAADHPLMNPDYDGGYDVRGWGHCYGLTFLLRLAAANAIPDGMAEEVSRRTRQYLAALQQVEIPEIGGWNYARKPRRAPSPASPFMTAPALQALFEAKRQGLPVDDAVVARGIAALERCRADSGSFAYATERDAARSRDGTPGAVGRMLAGESTLLLAGRATPAQVRGALDAFIAHWDRLEERRAKSGTHAPPFGVAPYYFYYAHWAAGQAVELLPQHERAEYRRRVQELLFRTREADGRWNDRIFPRSAAYGTACAILTLTAQGAAAPATWPPAAAAPPAATAPRP